VYRQDEQTVTRYFETTVVNTYPYAVLDLVPARRGAVLAAGKERVRATWQELARLWEKHVVSALQRQHEEEIVP